MPKLHSAKTVLAPKTLFVGGIVLLLVVLVGNPASRQALECSNYHTPVSSTLKIGNNTVKADVVSTEADREQGLSGRPCIKSNQVMVFIFDATDTTNKCFWMKDMRFPIDMVWLDSNKRAVYAVQDVEPATYPTQFCPDRPTSYVLEFKANETARLGLSLGTIVHF